MIKLLTCRICNNTFTAKKLGAFYCPECKRQKFREWNKKYNSKGTCSVCGGPCKVSSKRCQQCVLKAGKLAKICAACGGEKSPSHRSKFCCSCAIKNETGEHSASWKGGIKKSDGYVFVYAPNHPRVQNSKRGRSRRYVAEHILVWERTHNKPLPTDWCIHHLNGIRHDNRIENLIALPLKKHSSWTLLKKLQARIHELEQIQQLRLSI